MWLKKDVINVKASLMLCQLDNWNLRNSNCVPMTLSEVNAAGMLYCVRECDAGALCPHITLLA